MNEWLMSFDGHDPTDEGRRESLLTLGNGYFATRGAAPECDADDTHYPGTYVAGVYNRLGSEIAGRWVENESLVPEDDRLAAAALCLELGIDVNATNNAGNMALHSTIQGEFNRVIQFLVDKGANVNVRNKNGFTPLRLAEDPAAARLMSLTTIVPPPVPSLLQSSTPVSGVSAVNSRNSPAS